MTTWLDENKAGRRTTICKPWIATGVIAMVFLAVLATRGATDGNMPAAVVSSNTNENVTFTAPEEDYNKWFACPMSSNGLTVAWADLADIWRKTPDADASSSADLTLPIEHYENGRVKAVLHAGKAAIGRNNLIWSWNVNVDLFDPNGRADGNVKADACLYDRNTKRGYCPTAVKLVRTNATVSGIGMYWTMAEDRMRIFSNAVVTIDRATAKQPLAGSKRK